jgi:hypothetical protein
VNATLELDSAADLRLEDLSVEQPDVFSKCLCLTMTIRQFGLSRPIKDADYDVDADKERTKASMRLLKAPELKAVSEAISELRKIVYKNSVPSPLKAGTYMIPLAIVLDVDRQLRTQHGKIQSAVTLAALALPRLIDEDRDTLRSLFNPAHYPDPETFKAAYGVSWNLVSFGGPSALQKIDAALYERNAAEFAATIAEAGEEIRQLLRVELADLVNSMVERLSGEKDGKPKVFRDTLVKNVSEFLQTFEARNITSDAQLQRLVADARKLLDGVDPDTLRKSKDVRATVADGMARVKEQLDTLLVDRPGRAISFDDV